MKKENKTARQLLADFYNELSIANYNEFKDYKKKPTRKMAKKISDPILDKYQKIFEGAVKVLMVEMKIPKSLIKTVTKK